MAEFENLIKQSLSIESRVSCPLGRRAGTSMRARDNEGTLSVIKMAHHNELGLARGMFQYDIFQ